MKFICQNWNIPFFETSEKVAFLMKNIPGNRAANQTSRMRFSRPFFTF